MTINQERYDSVLERKPGSKSVGLVSYVGMLKKVIVWSWDIL